MVKLKPSAPVLPRTEAPFISKNDKALQIYLDILISVVPLIIWGIICFGFRSLLNVFVAAVVAGEIGFGVSFITKKRIFPTDLRSVVIGVLFALCMPSSLQIQWVALGAAIAEAVHLICAKYLPVYLDPVCTAVIAIRLLVSNIPSYVKPLIIEEESETGSQGLTKYALDVFYTDELPKDSFFDLILGRCAGPIGTVSVALIIICAIYLWYKRVINLKITGIFLGAAAIAAVLLPVGLDRTKSMFFELFAGAIFFGAVYLATDYFHVPFTDLGKSYYAAIAGALSVLIRLVFTRVDAVFPAILIAGLIVYPIDAFTRPKIGKKRKKAKQTDK